MQESRNKAITSASRIFNFDRERWHSPLAGTHSIGTPLFARRDKHAFNTAQAMGNHARISSTVQPLCFFLRKLKEVSMTNQIVDEGQSRRLIVPKDWPPVDIHQDFDIMLIGKLEGTPDRPAAIRVGQFQRS